MVIDVSGATNHDAWTVNNALRVLQPAPDLDFELEAKFDTVPAKQYQFEGIYVEQANGQFLRFEALCDGKAQLQAYVGRIIPGTSGTQVSRTAIPDVPMPTECNAGVIYMRLKRLGDQWTFSTSPDGTNWLQQSSFVQSWAVARVGVHAGNQQPNATSPTPAFTAKVDYFFNSAAPIKEEDRTVEPPVLQIARAENKVVLSWPATATGFVLESTPILVPASWSVLADTPVLTGDQYTVTLDTTDGRRFY
jgi:hypothetical protein